MSIIDEITARDREFVAELRSQLKDGLKAASNPELDIARDYEIHKEAFDSIIGYVSAYRPLLTSIKAEYEEIIDSIVRGHKEAQSLEMKVEAIAAVQPNLQNYKKRCAELEFRISKIKAENEEIKSEIANVLAARDRAAEEAAHKAAEAAAIAAERKSAAAQSRRRLPPGMSLMDATDASSLSAEKSRVSRELQQLQLKAQSHYVPIERKQQLTESLLDKIRDKEQVEQQLLLQRVRQQLLQLAAEAADAHLQAPPCNETAAAAIFREIKNRWPQRRHRPSVDVAGDSSGAEADLAGQMETNKIVEYLEKFHELLARGDYVAAAYHAANSFRGILRTLDTFARFKEIDAANPGLLLTFCEALLATASVYEGRLGPQLSFECVQAALATDRIDLVEHWITKELLTMTKEIGELVANHGDCKASQSARSYEIAHQALHSSGATFRAAECLVLAGRTDSAVSYSALEAGLQHDDMRRLLQQHPSVGLALSFVSFGCLTLSDVVGCFYVHDAWTELAWLLDSLIQDRAEAKGIMSHQAAMQVMAENPEVPASVWTEVAKNAPDDMRHLNELFSSSVVYEAFNRSLSSLQAAGL